MASLGVRHALTPTTRLLGEVEWVNWSQLGVIPIVLQGRSAWCRAGARLQISTSGGGMAGCFRSAANTTGRAALTLRTGLAYEISPVDGATTRLVQDPDSNRIWASIGSSYKLDSATRLDFSYSHVFFENDAPFDRVPGSTLFAGPRLLGTADISMDVISVGLKMDLSALLAPSAVALK